MNTPDLLRAAGILLYVASIAIVLRWYATAPELDRDDPRGLSDDERAELDIVRGEPGMWE